MRPRLSYPARVWLLACRSLAVTYGPWAAPALAVIAWRIFG